MDFLIKSGLILMLMSCLGCEVENDQMPPSQSDVDLCNLPVNRIVEGTKGSLRESLNLLSEKLPELSIEKQHAFLTTHTGIHAERIKRCMDALDSTKQQNELNQLSKVYVTLNVINDRAIDLVSTNKAIKESDLEFMRMMLKTPEN